MLDRDTNYPYHERNAQFQQQDLPSHLSGLHLLSPPPEGHVGVVVGGAIPLLLLDLGDEGGPPAVLALPHPVVIDSLDQVIVLIEQQFGLLKGYKLQGNRDKSSSEGAAGEVTTLTPFVHFLDKLRYFPAPE